jgi:hypothetical protein
VARIRPPNERHDDGDGDGSIPPYGFRIVRVESRAAVVRHVRVPDEHPRIEALAGFNDQIDAWTGVATRSRSQRAIATQRIEDIKAGRAARPRVRRPTATVPVRDE